MNPGEVLALAEVIKGVSEVVWDIAMAKVYADSVICTLWGCALFAIHFTGWVFFVTSQRQKRLSGNDDWNWGISLGILFALVVLLGSIGAFAASIARFVAPAYFAVQIVIGLV